MVETSGRILNSVPPGSDVLTSESSDHESHNLQARRQTSHPLGSPDHSYQPQDPTEQQVLPRSAPPSGFPIRTPPVNSPQPQQAQVAPPYTPEAAQYQIASPHSGTREWQSQHISQHQPQQSPHNMYNHGSVPFGGYAGPQLRTPPSPSVQEQQNDNGNELIQRFAEAIHAVPSHNSNGRLQGAPESASDDVSEGSPPANIYSGTLAPHVIQSMDKDLYRISLLVEHKRTLVSHLNHMCKSLRLGTHGLKKEKQERLLALAQRLRARGDAHGLRHIRSIVDSEGPPELRPLDGGLPTGGANPDHLQRATHAQIINSRSRRMNTPSASDNSAYNRAYGAYSNNNFAAQNPLVAPKPAVQLSFRLSPFYRLGESLRQPVIFMKPYSRRRLSQLVTFECSSAIVDQSDSHVYLVCQEFNPRAGDQQPIYFPFYNELELDGEVITANTRGIRGVAGSARPVDLKPIIKKHGGRHKLRITVVINDQGEPVSDKSFAFGVYYGYKMPHETLVEQIKTRPHIDLNHTKKMAMQAASGDDGDDVVMSSDAIYSLKDNVMMTRITVPIRSKACMHIECFDALTFVMLQDQAETWKCPICNRVITWESLAVDDFFAEILSTAGPEVETVSIKADGTWSVEDTDSMGEEETDSDDDIKPAPKRSRSEVDTEVVDLLSETDDEAPNPQSNTAHQPPANGSNQTNPSPAPPTQSQNHVEPGRGDVHAPPQQELPPVINEPRNLPNLDSHSQHMQGPRENQGVSSESQVRNDDESSIRGSALPSAEVSPATPDTARHEIYATIRAFQKSHNLMFDAPLKVTDNYSNPRAPGRNENSSVTESITPSTQQLGAERSPQSDTSPNNSHPQRSLSNADSHQRSPVAPPPVQPASEHTSQTMGQSTNEPASEPSEPSEPTGQSAGPLRGLNYAALARLIDDDDEDDDIIDLTGDD